MAKLTYPSPATYMALLLYAERPALEDPHHLWATQWGGRSGDC